jgi:rsbT co-antagonist protein RsbR
MDDRVKARIGRLEEILAQVGDGDLSAHVELGPDEEEDELTALERGINLLVVDLRAKSEESHEKEAKLLAQQRELEARLHTIEEQAKAIRTLSTPVIEVWDDILVLPLVGLLDTERSGEIVDAVLSRVSATQARCIVIDITGVPVVDTKTADNLVQVVRAASLLGARCVLTGASPGVAQTVVSLGVDLGSIKTLRNLKAGLKYCLAHLAGGREHAF